MLRTQQPEPILQPLPLPLPPTSFEIHGEAEKMNTCMSSYFLVWDHIKYNIINKGLGNFFKYVFIREAAKKLFV